jgi:hypothetical protein
VSKRSQIFAGLFILVCVIFTLCASMYAQREVHDMLHEMQGKPVLVGPVYDPNDPIYQWIPIPPDGWVEIHGDNERSRVLHCISEMRLALGTMGRKIIDLEAEVKELRAMAGGPE